MMSFHLLPLVTRHNKQSETLERSEKLEEMGAERPEILVYKIGLPKFQSPSSHDSLLTFSDIFVGPGEWVHVPQFR